MAAILISLILLLQGVPIQQGGTVKGVLRDSAGTPISGIRMAAVARPDSLEKITEGTAMAGIAETDAEGKYTLDNIPPGRYLIAAGRLDLQTYYPGTQSIAEARIVAIAPGSIVSDINFVLNNASFGRSDVGVASRATAVVPLTVAVENGGKLPLSANDTFARVRLQSATSDVAFPIDAINVMIPVSGTIDVRVTVEDLPDNYVVKSVMYGTTDITRGTFRLTQTISSVSMAIATAIPTPTASRSPSPLTITLIERPAASSVGRRVTGSMGFTGKCLIYISGKPGVVYSDGTFEFRNVPAGRHIIATLNNPSSARAAIVVVGDQDVSGIELKETMLLPPDIRQPKDPLPAGNYSPGTTVPLSRVSGIVLEESTKEPIREGEVVVRSADASRRVPIDENGRFETFSLLPGTYEIRLQIFAHSTVGPTIVVDDKDVQIQMTTRRLY